jgi:hypothetical protein
MSSASGRPRAIAAKALSSSSGARISTGLRIYRYGAQRSTSASAAACTPTLELTRGAMRDAFGTTSFNSSNVLTRPGSEAAQTVMLPPGRARLATNPEPIGITGVEEHTDGGGVASGCRRRCSPVTMMSTLRRTNSAARRGKRSLWPSEYRRSKVKFAPSIQPRSAFLHKHFPVFIGGRRTGEPSDPVHLLHALHLCAERRCQDAQGYGADERPPVRH